MISQIKNFLKDREKVYYVLAAFIALLAIILLIFFLRTQKTIPQNISDGVPSSTTTPIALLDSCLYRNNLTGDCVNSQAEVSLPLIGVMIENFVDARPQSGIAEASLVYEAPAEGNITRFLAIFRQDQSVVQAGPVRSARPYYLDWISEYPGAMYMHVGGSPEALDKLAEYKIFDVNEFYRGIYFWRDQKKLAPHNVFTSSELWKASYEKFADKSIASAFDSWVFSSATSSCALACVNQIEIPFLRPSYDIVWRYNSDTLKYDRFHGLVAHLDSAGTPVRASTVVVQYVTDKILDDVGRRALGTLGSGKAEVYVLGNKIEGTWKKDSRTSRTKFFDGSGKEIAFAPGHIWIEIVPVNIEVTTN